MRLQLASPLSIPISVCSRSAPTSSEWSLPSIHEVSGLHRHVVRLVELGEGHRRRSYVVKELPDHLVLREYRLLRSLDDDELPTVDVVAAVTERTGDRDGLLVTRHLDYSLPYRSLLSGRGLRIPYLGERLLDALVGLLVRLHLAGFFWGDCSLSNTLFRRDAGALSAFVIDVETSERYPSLTDGQRKMDLDIATENVAGGLLDLQIGGRLVEDVDPWEVATNIEDRYASLWDELTAAQEFQLDELWRVEKRIERLHDLGFDVAEMDVDRRRGGRAAARHAAGRRVRLPRGPPVRARPGWSPRRTRRAGCSTTSAPSAPSCASRPARRCPRTSSPCAGSTSASSRRSPRSRRS